MPLTNVIFEDKLMQDARLDLSDKESLYFLGPNLILKDCTIILKVPTKRLIVAGARFINCTIEARQELKNFRWLSASFEGCRISGKFLGNDFGLWPGSESKGGIEDCDLTAALPHRCRFVGCDASTLRFPRWPCVTILETFRRSRELEALRWPGRDHMPLDYFSQDPPTTVAVSYVATAMAKECGVSEKEIRTFIERLEGVVY